MDCTVSAAVSIVVNVENLATADVSTARGTITSGSFQQTWTDDDVYEVLTEALQGGNPAKRRSLLEHTWRFDVAAGSRYVFNVNAYRSELKTTSPSPTLGTTSFSRPW